MAETELRRRTRQRDVLRKRLEDPEVIANVELAKRIKDSLGETEERLKSLQPAAVPTETRAQARERA